MSMHEVSARLEEKNISHIVVIAKSAAKYKDIKSFTKSIRSPEAKQYAQDYFEWVSGGRSGSAPKCEDPNFKMLKYIRSVVSQLV